MVGHLSFCLLWFFVAVVLIILRRKIQEGKVIKLELKEGSNQEETVDSEKGRKGYWPFKAPGKVGKSGTQSQKERIWF